MLPVSRRISTRLKTLTLNFLYHIYYVFLYPSSAVFYLRQNVYFIHDVTGSILAGNKRDFFSEGGIGCPVVSRLLIDQKSSIQKNRLLHA